MKYFFRVISPLVLFSLLQSCSASRATKSPGKIEGHQEPIERPLTSKEEPSPGKPVPSLTIHTKNTDPKIVVDFAETLIGTPYKYGSAKKENGFDCSGFITYVFSNYDISVPRISRDFTNAGVPVPIGKSKRGDLILFTGRDTTNWIVGHMGFVTENNNGKIKFIHSSSGQSRGVIISEMTKYYATRFVKVIRVFNE